MGNSGLILETGRGNEPGSGSHTQPADSSPRELQQDLPAPCPGFSHQRNALCYHYYMTMRHTLKQKIISSQSSPSSLEPKLQSSEHLSWWLTMRAHKKSVVHFSSWKKATYSRCCNTLVLFGATLAGLYSYLLSLFVSIQKAWLWCETHTVGYVKYWSEQPWDNPGATRNQKGDPEKGKECCRALQMDREWWATSHYADDLHFSLANLL